jgi:hypothetical protein
MFKVMFGRGAQNLTEMPPHIQQVDHIICISPPDIRAVLIRFYTTGGTIQDKAISFGLDRRTLMRRVDRADWYVHSCLDMLPMESASSAQNEFGVAELRRRASEPASRKAHNPERRFNSAARFHSLPLETT